MGGFVSIREFSHFFFTYFSGLKEKNGGFPMKIEFEVRDADVEKALELVEKSLASAGVVHDGPVSEERDCSVCTCCLSCDRYCKAVGLA